ncbi:bifunctional aminoglycoside phosphotransferase/ATP-binding protein [Marinobacterium arenosum]|uniref:bifunctional aminoglycoside phosphotransferase/ATP-binding protein n=1 Tax=Marinobacterium arenosum TaxID=2862496 RepID=UPI0028F3FF44|nr:AAA family ATPase [Marinobacterium arenosum]
MSEPIQVIETHISWLLLTGEFAYKIKKPVDFGFLDFTTLEQRKHCCEEELRLNQRLAPDIYQQVVAICGSANEPVLDADDEPFEYAVRMRQFNPDERLDILLRANRFPAEWIDRLAEQIADFHSRIPIVASDSPWGEPDTIWDVVSDNFLHIGNVLDSADDWQQLQRLSNRTAQQFRALTDLIRQRKAGGHVRECHGDLHLGNINLFNGELRLFDCIEFNLQFRWIDTICDLAFLLMDLEANGQFRWASRCLNQYLELGGDYEGVQLLNFYKAYRAMVRAKVAMIGMHKDIDEFRHYAALANRYANRPQPVLYLMNGVSGSGKSTLSDQMIEQLGIIRIRSDVERKRLFAELSREGQQLELYGKQMNVHTYNHLLHTSRALLQAGYSVVVDATFIRRRSRLSYAEMAHQLRVPMRILSCSCDPQVLEQRLEERTRQGGDPSDADVAIMQSQLENLQPLGEDELPYSYTLDSEDPQAVDKLIARLRADGLVESTL